MASAGRPAPDPDARPEGFPEGAPAAPSGNELGISRRTTQGSDITYTGTGTSTDIIVASARAYISAINRAIAHQGKL